MKTIILTTTIALLLGFSISTTNAYTPYCGNSDECYPVGDTTQMGQVDNANVVDDAIISNDSPYDIINAPYNIVTESQTEILIEGQNVNDSYDGLPERIQPPGERLFIFSPHILRWAAYDRDGYQVAAGKANGGSDFCAELGKRCHTPVGVFRVQAKGDVSCISKRFPLPRGGAPMPYCMHFGGGFAIHGSPYISNGNTSHGCIRVYTPAAAWLSRYFMNPGTKVMVLPY